MTESLSEPADTSRDRISETLAHIETEHGVAMLYACETGSRAWGFASPDSDFDVRFIYARPVEQYLTLKRPREVIELPIVDDLDVNGWDLFKACRLLQKSNPPLLEWLGSPTEYLARSSFVHEMREHARSHYSARSCCEHYFSMAVANYKTYVEGRDAVIRKKYLYILRPIACIQWMLVHKTFPPTVFAHVLSGISIPSARMDIESLLKDKLANHEMGTAPMNRTLDRFIRSELDTLPVAIRDIAPRTVSSAALNEIVRAALLG